MKFLCKTSDLQQGIQLVSRAIGGQQTLPILGNILIEAEGKRCVLSATDLELSIITNLPSSVENEGSITIPAKAIQNYAQYNSDEEVLLETVEGTLLKCTSSHSKTIITGEQAGEYPTISAISKETSFTLKAAPLLDALQKVTFASAKTTLRPVLSGVFLRFEKKQLILVATDSYRLSECRVDVYEAAADGVSCIIPAKVLDELKNIISLKKGEKEKEENKKDDQKIEVILSSQQIQLQFGQTKILSRLIEGKFPDYEQIIPKENNSEAEILHSELLTTTKRMHYFAKETNNNLLFKFSKNNLQVTTPQTQIGKDEANIPIETKGDENKIALSSTYVLDFLSHVNEEKITAHITDSMHPAVFKIPKNKNFLHLIMPLRIQEE